MMKKETKHEGLSHSQAYRRPAVYLAAGVLAFTAAANKDSISEEAFAKVPASSDIAPGALANRADALVESTARAWQNHQLPDGRFIDPVEGPISFYGSSMLGNAMVEQGLAKNNPSLVASGIQAEVSQVERPTDGVFETINMADIFIYNEQHLKDDPAWLGVRHLFKDYLTKEKTFQNGDGDNSCFTNPNCFNNKVVGEALARFKIEKAIGDSGPVSTASAEHKPTMDKRTSVILTKAGKTALGDAKRVGYGTHYENASILSDPGTSPTAYHVMTTGFLGHIIEEMGPENVPKSVKSTFLECAKGVVGMMSPSGDVAYIGRGQGQVWNLGVGVYSLSMAAKITSDPVMRGRYLAGADRLLDRMQKLYTPGDWGMPLTPRDKNPANYAGIDGYANKVVYNGLASDSLQSASEVLSSVQPAPAENIPADSNGAFVDPSATKFAAVTHGKLFYVIHGDTTSKADARYGMGLVDAEQRQPDGNWAPAIPNKPLTRSYAVNGPALIYKGKKYVPGSGSIKANAGGKVTVNSRWKSLANSRPLKGSAAAWEFSPIGDNGVEMRLKASRKGTLQLPVLYEQGSKVKVTNRRHSVEVTKPNGDRTKYILRASGTVKVKFLHENFDSGYARDMQGLLIETRARRNENLRLKTIF
jgi:hypothetical protein